MPEIKVHGTFYEMRGWSKRPVIYVDPPDDDALRSWHKKNKLFTRWLESPHPRTGVNVPVLYPNPAFTNRLGDEDPVVAVLNVRPEKRGNGMKFVDVVRP